MPTITEKRSAFRRLHAQGCFVIPNPWDVGSARLLASFGFKALATTSSGFAWTLGKSDNRVTIDEALEHLRGQGIPLIDEQPRLGSRGATIAFVHPKAVNGVLLELIDYKWDELRA